MKLNLFALLATTLLGAAATYATATSYLTVEAPVTQAEAQVEPVQLDQIFMSELNEDSAVAKELYAKFHSGSNEPITVVIDEVVESADGSTLDAAAAPSLACGDSTAIATPDSGVTGQGYGATDFIAFANAYQDALRKLDLYAAVKCDWCPNPNQCFSYYTLLNGSWKLVDITTLPDGTFCITLSYQGPILAGCRPCDYF